MQSITNGVYSLLLGAEGGDATGSKLPPPLQPMPTACSGNPGVPTHVVLGPGDGTAEGAKVALELSNRVFVEAAKNKNRRTCVLLKTPMTPPAVEETMKTWIAAEAANEASNFRARGETPPTPVAPKAVFEREEFSRGYNAVVALAKNRVSHVEVGVRTIDLNTGRPTLLVVTSCGSTFRKTAPPQNLIPLPKHAEEGMRALAATLRGVLSTTFDGRELTGTVLGVFQRDASLLRLICWHGQEDASGATPVLLYTAVAEAYAQHAAGNRRMRPTWNPRWYTREQVALGPSIAVSLDEMSPLDQEVWREKLGVRAWLPPAEGRAADTIVVGTRDEDNLRGLDVAVSQDKLFFVEV